MSLTRRAIAGALGAIVTILLAVAVGVPLACHRVPPWSFAGFSMTLCPCVSPCPCARAAVPRRPQELVPVLDMLTNKIAYADNLVYRYSGPDLPRRLDYSGRQANMKTFEVAKDDYDGERLLAQDARAMRGGWTPRQRAIVAAMRESGELLPTPFRILVEPPSPCGARACRRSHPLRCARLWPFRV